jgi:hypothetical protein
MARTREGDVLTDLHRTSQARIATELAATLVPLWRILDIENLDATTEPWILAASAAIDQHRAASIATTAAYLRTFRTLELPGAAPFAFPAAPILEPAAVATSLLVTGPVALKSKLGAGMRLTQAVEQSLAGSIGSGTRHALNGGRELTLSTMKADPQAVRYVRVTSPGACDFCRTIAGYSHGNDALTGDFQCHDHCNCQPELVYG